MKQADLTPKEAFGLGCNLRKFTCGKTQLTHACHFPDESLLLIRSALYPAMSEILIQPCPLPCGNSLCWQLLCFSEGGIARQINYDMLQYVTRSW